jgi:hypothetical protein
MISLTAILRKLGARQRVAQQLILRALGERIRRTSVQIEARAAAQGPSNRRGA